MAYGKKGNFDKEIEDYNEAIHLDPNEAMIYFNRADAHRMKGETDKAIADYTEAIRLNPQYAESIQPGLYLWREGRVRQGHRRLHRGHSAQPERRRSIHGTGAWHTRRKVRKAKA